MTEGRQPRRDGGRGDANRGGGRGRDGSNRGGGRDRDGRGFGSRRDDAGRERSGSRGSGGPRRGHSQHAPSERSRQGDPARLTAYEVLRAVADEGAYANLLLPQVLRRRHLHGRDAGFATELTYGAIRMQGLYDRIIAIAAARPVASIDANVVDTLRLGAHQLLGMRVPEHAAADQTVALARQVNGAGAATLVNAVMRRISERSREEWLEAVTDGVTDPIERLSIEESHPTWVLKALRQALLGHGTSTATTIDADLAALAHAHNAPPKVTLVARPGLATLDELTERGGEPSRLSRVGVVRESGDPSSIAAVRNGRAAVQDEGSQLIPLALVDVPLEGAAADAPWLDLCAGPGGKAGLLAGLAVQAGRDLVANEVSDHRAGLVRLTLRPAVEAATEAGTTIEVRTGDGRDVGDEEPARYARVLVDAPCTGLGALRRRPEARWRRQPHDVSDLTPLQHALLASAIDATISGGVIAYATCGPHLAETIFTVKDVLKKRDDVELIDAREYLRDASGAPIEHVGDGPMVQLWPHLHGTDGMFLALLRKR
ncbi:RsmB/NOP family class I SAM-dependent RNA methyltransferase [Kribbia dieselivorans]|uniref:RsmB/NOP family class I SAM-dependent RNA methyltransferase n=1 Tax=Kribbia dieselivorans TaxID=331526 RepID=UPI000839A10B|nr:transcription antitermination factor NusB [Kribbia dieselivorans]